jgi:hypothetical protein
MAESTKTRVAKKPVSEKQLIANRMDSRKSTGPRTEAGRARASMNNCQHGMRSSKDVLPWEDGALYEKRRRDARQALKPRDAVQEALVDRFVRLEWRGERGEAVEDARAARKVHEVVEGAQEREAAEVDRLTANLTDCLENLRALMRLRAGVLWLIQQFMILRDRLAASQNLLGSQRKRMLALLGKSYKDALRDDPVALRWVLALIGARFGRAATAGQIAGELGGWPKDGMARAEFDIRVQEMGDLLPDKAAARALLLEYVAAEVSRLAEHLEVLEPLAERSRALEAVEARGDTTAEGARLGQQILASYRGSDAALRRLEALQNSRRPGPGRGREKKKAPAAASATSPGPVQADVPKTDEAISEQSGTNIAVAQRDCLGPRPEGQAPLGARLPTPPQERPKVSSRPPRRETFGPEDGGVMRPAPSSVGTPGSPGGSDPRHSDTGRPSEGHSQPDPSMPQTAEAISQQRADEAILTPQAVAAVPADPARGDDLGPDEPLDPELIELYQRIVAIRPGPEDQAAAEMSREEEQWERQRKERLDWARREQLEELDRRNETFLKTRRDPPDPDPAAGAGGEAGRAPPDQG